VESGTSVSSKSNTTAMVSDKGYLPVALGGVGGLGESICSAAVFPSFTVISVARARSWGDNAGLLDTIASP
jgi:hypothetical protein